MSARALRAAIAAHMLGAPAPAELGAIRLHAHQREAVARLSALLALHRGALLADEVGLGKTFVALALARSATRALVVAPAAVRDHWLECAQRAGVPIFLLTSEGLSRHQPDVPDVDLVVIDEAHLFRNPATRRFHAAMRLCRDARVLLLSATPVQNDVRDLRVILSLFLGETAHALSEPDLARHVVRRASADVGADSVLPRADSPLWLEPPQDVDCLDRILALPPPVPPWDGDDAGVLLTFTLVRQWASSRAALRSALRRRVARGMAMLDALRAGRVPSRAELAGWCGVEGEQQLFLAGLLEERAHPSVAPLAEQVDRHVAAVRALAAWLDASPDPDVARAAALAELVRRHSPARVVAFGEFAETVTCLYRCLLVHGRVAMLTHRGGRIASGPISRAELLAAFRPGAGARAHPRERVELLLTTDVLSEGVNLSDAGVLVHLDLAWNPARLEQRLGRLRRIGGTHTTLAVYAFRPPAAPERLLALERRLRLKRARAARAVGVAGAILPESGSENGGEPAPQLDTRIAAVLRRWRGSAPAGGSAPLVAAAHGSRSGALACIDTAGTCRLLAVTDGSVTDAREAVLALCESTGDRDAHVDSGRADAAMAAVSQWLAAQRATSVVELAAMRVARTRRSIVRRIDAIAAGCPRHRRSTLAPLLSAARAVSAVPLAAGREAVLRELADAVMPDEPWLRSVAQFASIHVAEQGDDRVVALLLVSHGGTVSREEPAC